MSFTPTSAADGVIHFHLNLPFGSGNVERLTLSTNHTDLIISNFVAGALLGRLVEEKDPELRFNKDYVYGALFAQLLQENIDTGNYQQGTNWINPDAVERGRLLSPGQGGPYQINDYSKRLETDAGIGLVNFVALQKGLGYSVEDQDSGAQTAAVGPESLDDKYFGPMAAAFFHLNDLNRLIMNNAESWGPQHQYFATCMSNLRDPRSDEFSYNNLDMLLNAAYNAGTYSRILNDYVRICARQFGTGPESTQVKSQGDYSLSDTAYQSAIGTSESAGSTFILYPRQVRLYLDQIYNSPHFPSAAITGENSVRLSARDIGYVFANSMGTLAYVDDQSRYRYVDWSDGDAAYHAALDSLELTEGSVLDISKKAERSRFFALLDASIDNVANRLNTTFGQVTQTTIR